MEGWNPFKKKAPKVEDDSKVKVSVGEAAVYAGIAGLAAVGAHEAMTGKDTAPAAAPLPAVDTMPAEHVDPAAGKTPDSAPDAIVVEQTGVVHPEAMMEEDDSGPEPVGQ